MIGVPLWFKPPALSVRPPSLETLDEHQRAVVAWRNGEALCAASAGSGKTHVSVQRVVALLHEGEAPEGLLTLTFNKDAADTFRDRIATALGRQVPKKSVDRIPVYTFHAWSLMVLRTWLPGNPRWRNILGGFGGDGAKLPSRVKLWFQCIDKVKPTFARRDWRWWSDLYDRSRDAGMPRDIVGVDAWLSLRFPHWPSARVPVAARMFDHYETLKDVRKAIDFCDMTAYVGQMIDQWEVAGRPATDGCGVHPVEALRTAYRHVQVDECQDMNAMRWKIALHLGGSAESLLAVGDARQSIYGFAGALPERFIERIDAGATLLTLPVNRRSTSAIVEHANAIARGRSWHLGGDGAPRPDANAGVPVRYLWTHDDYSEAQWLADTLAGIPNQSRHGVAVLGRTNASLILPEMALMVRGVPCFRLGTDGGTWDTEPGKDIRGALHAANVLEGGDMAKADGAALYAGCMKIGEYVKGVDLVTVLQEVQAGRGTLLTLLTSKSPACKALGARLAILAGLIWTARCERTQEWLVKRHADETGDADEMGNGNPEIDDKTVVYEMLCGAASAAGSLDAVEAMVVAAREAVKRPDAVCLSTMHRAKGQEWNTVYAIQVRAGMLPHKKAEDIEEERRLYYVACTRAKEQLIVSSGGVPSEFWVSSDYWADVEDERTTTRTRGLSP